MPFLSAAFRPMFLGAALWACLSMILWILYWSGLTSWQPGWFAIDWHVHELLFGYGSAVLCGFLLTAIPNWTNRAPVAGPLLGALFLLWLLGRVGVTLSTFLPAGLVIALTLSFPLAYTLIAAREVLAAGNRRNLPVILMAALFLLGNALFLQGVQSDQSATSQSGARLGLSVLILLIGLIGGRIIPLFTRNWLSAKGLESAPVTLFSRADGVLLGFTALALIGWTFWTYAPLSGVALAVVGLGHFWRLSRWQGWRCGREPLILMLHLGYGFVPLGFVLTALPILGTPISELAGLHAWTAGAIGTMTATVMTRASLGHSGRALRAGWSETAFLSLIFAAGCARVASALLPGNVALLHGSAALWIAGFGLFALRFIPVMLRPRVDQA